MEQARQSLVDVERRRLVGEASEAETKRAEVALDKARATAREPWGERVEAIRQAWRDVNRQVGALIIDHLDELLAGLDQEAERARERCNRALEEVVASYRAREGVAARVDRLAGTIRRPRYGDIALTRLEPVVREASRILESDPPGEAAPRLKADPRLPRSGAIPAVEESMAPLVRTT